MSRPTNKSGGMLGATKIALVGVCMMVIVQLFAIFLAVRAVESGPILEQSVLDDQPHMNWWAAQFLGIIAANAIGAVAKAMIWVAIVLAFDRMWRIGRLVLRRPRLVFDVIAKTDSFWA